MIPLTVQSQSTVFIIFGATGDLTWRKLAPALYNLFLNDSMPNNFSIIGTARSKLSDDDFQKKMLDGVNQFSRNGKADKKVWGDFSKHVSYQSSDVQDDEDYKGLGAKIKKHEEEWKQMVNVVFYLAVSPHFFPVIAKKISDNKLATNASKSRIIIEKPFGHDLESAQSLNTLLSKLFQEEQIYRIDHYLGKETVQNIMAFRFANSILEPIWNRNYIQHVQISVTEQLGVENRGSYYEGAGALRDMIQNHLLQLLCLVAMETPINFNADEVRNRKVDVLHAMRKFEHNDIRKIAVRGQYAKGWINGEEVKAYRKESDVADQSNTETFAAVKFFIDNWRWQGVPFYVRTGKRMHQTTSTITIQFKDVPHCVFPIEASDNWQQNRLVISIQPEMSIRLQLQVKRPGLDMILNTVDMLFNYKGTYTKDEPEAYETLLTDIMLGDQTLFMRGDQVEAAWDLLMPILNAWTTKESISFPNYHSGSWGPELAEALIAQDGFHWFTLPFDND
jgi:glucose-6-phosphate 1-dehydrogenase